MEELIDRTWDVVVIGTGMGGGTAGRALAEAGKSVLFLEKGRRGLRAERHRDDGRLTDPVARFVRGLWPERVHGTVNGVGHSVFAPLGCGVGGSSVFYAATLERPEPHDLDHSDASPHPSRGWPVTYDEMRPWFEAAERVFKVHGEVDPLSAVPCPELARPGTSSAGHTAIVKHLRANGQHPYHLHSAVAQIDGCLQCLGAKCPHVCKMDGRSAGLEPALATGRATLMDECEVVEVRGSSGHITHVDAIVNGRRVEIRARQFVLAAGALNSPRLLLASQTDYGPQGCANVHGQVGRHLMFHLNEMFAVWPPHFKESEAASKSVGMRDLYMVKGQRMGMVQAMGVSVSHTMIASFLKEQIEGSALRRLAPLARFAAWPASRILGSAHLFVGLMEDLPYAENRVVLNRDTPSRIQFEYTIHDELLERRRLFRKAIRRAFKGMRPLFGGWIPSLNYGHACGTLRAGTDPKTSVVNAEGRAHGIDNLFVVDASFFPTSMGVNPSLTIAANALRVADCMRRSA